MPMLVRATTTTNAQGRKQQRLALPSTYKLNEIDADYLQTLKLIDQTRRQQDNTPILPKKNLHRSDALRQKKPKPSEQFSSKLSPIAQEAMVKTYEDTLISHLTNVYSSKRIGAVLPRLPTATFRNQLPIIKNTNKQNQMNNNIQEAQNLLDNILNNTSEKEEMLCQYVKWQQQWTKNFV